MALRMVGKGASSRAVTYKQLEQIGVDPRGAIDNPDEVLAKINGTGKPPDSPFFGNAAPIEVTSEKSKSGGGKWKRQVLEATVDDAGNMRLDYAKADKYEQPNNNTTWATYTLKAGIYNPNNSGKFTDHNIKWDAVKTVTGQTFNAASFLKEKGFTKWNAKAKQWEKP